jgi:hypothetical protein
LHWDSPLADNGPPTELTSIRTALAISALASSTAAYSNVIEPAPFTPAPPLPVVTPGQPLIPIILSKNEAAKLSRAARQAVCHIFDLPESQNASDRAKWSKSFE